ncbi:MAG: glycoside hydrolase family 127 protein, partial [Candidatus Eisenbacteria bacterium]|nr:glycoside hydrolase family 127 protein [Candidatus Eisenbacteria bacterium]
DPALKEGGLNNLREAGKKLRGEPAGKHLGYVFSNAYVFNTLESMCCALLVEPGGDTALLRAQGGIRSTIEEWIPIILAAQEPDGYFQTSFTLGDKPRWTLRGDHEGYVAGYFLEAAIAHYYATEGKDRRLYDAARKLADCWEKNIGPPPKRRWWDGHEEMEQALTRYGRFIDAVEGKGQGTRYIALAKFLLDSRSGGGQYDQSHAFPVNQKEAVGHAVRAVYLYSAMTDIAILTGAPAYRLAVDALWDNLVEKKMYVTGGVGSGETAEGYGDNYSLPLNAYCESCANCGMLFWQQKMVLLHGDGRYADLMELVLYNGVLGSLDLAGENFTYTNSMDEWQARYRWHVCPCCVGNIPRTLLQLPGWTYATADSEVAVNLFVGSSVVLADVAGSSLEIVQTTDYPWDGKVTITVNPAADARFTLMIRVPDRSVSGCYSDSPEANGLRALSLNGRPVAPVIERGYARIARRWKKGDTVTLELPMVARKVKASDSVEATRGRVALQYGPLVYNIENVDHQNRDVSRLVLPPSSTLRASWEPSLLGGCVTVTSTLADGTPMTAVPNFLRNNRGGRTLVWIRDREPALISPIAYNATPSSSFCSSWESVYGLNDQVEPKTSADRRGMVYGNWDRTTPEWVQYDFDRPYTVGSTGIYWFSDGEGLAAPSAWSMQYWDGSAWADLQNPSGYGVALDRWNLCSFTPVTTARVRVTVVPGKGSTAIAEWKVQ